MALLYSIRGERLYGIIHARKSYRRFLQGVSHAHPYHMRSGPYDLFFAHNGSVSRTFFRNGELPYTDSYMILRDISEVMSNHTPREAYAIVMERIKEGSTSLNSALLAFSEGGGPELLVYYFYNRDNLREKEEYYKMYRWGSYIYSATVNHYLGYRGSEIKFGDVEQVS
ncbi:glutamine amidotransferase [Metallosphaera hakonensis]|uniref:glutamine amidotransferase n=1 Tax=Metallosphaera hakonensis TaxID=79601 RepID=UPI001F0F88F3|nr:glutamine amidotransferase [Metallosphaera hakonensis]